MDVATITKMITESPEGGTVSVNGFMLPTDGYFVGGAVSALIVDEESYPNSIEHFVQYLLGNRLAPYVGWWTDEETGKLWVDATDWFTSYDVAEQVCRERGEIAFYDIERQRSFRPVQEV